MKSSKKRIISSIILSFFLSSCIYTSSDIKTRDDEVAFLKIKLEIVKDDYDKFYKTHNGKGDIVNYQYFSQIFVPPIMYLPILNYTKPTMIDTAASSVGFILGIKYTWLQMILFILLLFFYWVTPIIILILLFYVCPNYINFLTQKKKIKEYKQIIERDLPLQREDLLKFRQLKKQNNLSLQQNIEASIAEAKNIIETANSKAKRIMTDAQNLANKTIDDANEEHGNIILEAKKEAALIISKANLKNLDIKD
jgi:vacuolar-type H+-ATPase subunit H